MRLQFWEIESIRQGYNVRREWQDARKEIRLSPDDLQRIEHLMGALKEDSEFVSFPATSSEISSMQGAGMEFVDALLYGQARQAGCDYFITRDTNLISQPAGAGPVILSPESFIEKTNELGGKIT